MRGIRGIRGIRGELLEKGGLVEKGGVEWINLNKVCLRVKA
jgi:hypothetical protein